MIKTYYLNNIYNRSNFYCKFHHFHHCNQMIITLIENKDKMENNIYISY